MGIAIEKNAFELGGLDGSEGELVGPVGDLVILHDLLSLSNHVVDGVLLWRQWLHYITLK